ncbi:cache domain-containing protein [Limnobacter sp.]|uniref:sensor histidine kinase n=1 Tax=Limnobacter sp. TaxID=2003368 RepID=UPI0035128FFB
MEPRIDLRPFPSRGHFWPSHWTVKTKLVVTACIPLMVLVPVVAMLVWSAGQAAYNKILISKVRSDLVLAQQKFFDLKMDRRDALRSWAESAYLRQHLARNGGKLDPNELGAQAEKLGLAYLRLVGPTGLVRSAHPSRVSYMLDPASFKALNDRREGVHMVLMSAAEMAEVSETMAARAVQPIVPTNAARPSAKSVENRGLVVQLLQPLYHQGEFLGTLEGGLLLNGNLALVDQINDLIYSPNTLLEGSIGTTTIFVEDVRVATTVRADGIARALGTRVSEEVRRSVLGRGEIWLERAYVVSDWYVAAYAPLLSPEGARIGMFYVGFLEEPYASLKTQLLYLFLIAVGVSMFLGAALVVRLTSGIFYPLRRMNYVMSRQEGGDTAARVGDLRRQDEFADLAEHFDALLDQLESRRHELESLNTELDERVRQRTADLQAANQKLHQAVEQLLASEKLAVMGQLTAGIAHEFNNPLAIMMGHLDLIRIALSDPESAKNLRLLDEQIQRMRNIVQKLLQFCRPDEYASYTEALDVNEVVQDSLFFAKAEMEAVNAQVELELQARNTVQISKTELQQVMVNLLINAAHALEGHDRRAAALIRIESRDLQLPDGQDAVGIRVMNNGDPIPEQQLRLIFRMFYTTKQAGRGTGLGLPVSRMLLQRYGGDLTARSPMYPEDQPDHGACFEIVLRCKARPSADILKESAQQLLQMEKKLSEGN